MRCTSRLAVDDVDRAEKLAGSLSPSDRQLRLQASVLLTQHSPAQALTMLAATEPCTLRDSLDTAVLRTRAMHWLGSPEFDDTLASCVALARRERFLIAVLTDGLSELTPRLSYHLRSGPIGEFERDVLDRLDRPRGPMHAMDAAELVNQLTEREQVILRYLDSRPPVTDIAAECFVSRNTIRTHVKAIYRKLGVSSRPEAVAHGRQLHLL